LTGPVVTKLKRLEDYRFSAEFDMEGVPNIIVDEAKPVGKGSGPNSTRLFSAAVGQCLSSSLLYCLGKARINAKNLATTVNAITERNPEGRLRIKRLDVQIHISVDEQDKTRLTRCLDIFEDFCTVTQSVRKGVEVNVNIA
jgi:uncharacterized OsmC-like protein